MVILRQQQLHSQKYSSWRLCVPTQLLSSTSTSVTNSLPSRRRRNIAEHAGLAHLSSIAASRGLRGGLPCPAGGSASRRCVHVQLDGNECICDLFDNRSR